MTLTRAEHRKLRLFSIHPIDRDGLIAFARDLGITGTELDTVRTLVLSTDVVAYLYAAIRVRS